MRTCRWILGHEVPKLRQIEPMRTQVEEDLRRRFARFPRLHSFGFAFARSIFFLAVVLSCSVSSAQKTSPPNAGLRIIVVASTEQAQQILIRLRNGEDFAALAKEKSVDATADDGGYMGKVDPAALRPELREALKGISPGQTTGVVKVPTGFAILKVLTASDSGGDKNANPARIQPLVATGTIRYAPNVGGKNEADLAFRSLPKPEGWSQDLSALCSIRRKSVSVMIDQLEKNVPSLEFHRAGSSAVRSTRSRPSMVWRICIRTRALWTKQWRNGNPPTDREQSLPGAMPELEEVLGIAYLHKSEMENGVYAHPDDRCIFPPRSSIRYSKTADSRRRSST